MPRARTSLAVSSSSSATAGRTRRRRSTACPGRPGRPRMPGATRRASMICLRPALVVEAVVMVIRPLPSCDDVPVDDLAHLRQHDVGDHGDADRPATGPRRGRRCRGSAAEPPIVVARKVSASAASISMLKRPLAMVLAVEDAPVGSRHSRAAAMCSSEVVTRPIVVATARPWRSSAHATTTRVPMATSRPANPRRAPSARCDDRLVRRSGPALHEARRGGVEAEAEGEQHVDGEVDPQDLERQ